MCTMCVSPVTHLYLLASSYYHDSVLVFNLDHTRCVYWLMVVLLGYTPMLEACHTLVYVIEHVYCVINNTP